MAIIGISGKKTSGKDTVGNIIQYLTHCKNDSTTYEEWCNTIHQNFSDWKIKKFANNPKDIVCMLIGCAREQLEDETFKNTELGEEWWYFKGRNGSLISYSEDSKRNDEDLIKPTPRLLLQLIGTECGRDIIHPNIWVNSVFSDYFNDFKDESKNDHWIITDTRFPNEANAIKQRGGIIIRVNSGRCNNNDNHPSETSLDNYKNFDYVISNDGTIEQLVEEVRKILIKEKLL